MIPSVAILRIQNCRERRFRLWLPIFLLWIPVLLLAPILLLLMVVVTLALRVNPFRLLVGVWGVLSALSGTHVHVGSRGKAVTVRII
jgi:hypothetical protein